MKTNVAWRTWTGLGTLLFAFASGDAPGQTCPEPGAAKTYTSTEDFNPIHANFHPGEPVRNNTIGQDGELTIVSSPATLPYIWVACSYRGTVVRIATEEHYCPIRGELVAAGDVLGEYRAAPESCWGGGYPENDPSRVTVDFDGNAWTGNRIDVWNGETVEGHIVKIGTGLAHQWIDRNGNGVLDTSMGLGDVRPWPGPPDHYCGPDDVGTAEDELILLYQTVPSWGTRTLALDRDNNIWIGGYELPHYHGLLDGQTGEVLRNFEEMDCGGYGGLVDCNGVLWSPRGASGGYLPLDKLLRYDPGAATSDCIDVDWSYGLAVDLNGYIWNSRGNGDDDDDHISKLNPSGQVQGDFDTRGRFSRGVAVTWSDNHVWVANSKDHDVTRLGNDGTWVGNVDLQTQGGEYPTGVAVDSTGLLWVTNYVTNNVMAIDPTLGSFGEVVPELTVELGYAVQHPSRRNAGPYNYSDMTGVSLLWTTAPAGVWTAVCEGPEAGTVWQKLDWNATPGAGSVRVQVRAADWDYDLGKELYVDVEDDVPFTCAITGKYLQIRVVLSTECGAEPWPTLQDLTVYACDMIDCNENDIADYCECPEPTLFSVSPFDDDCEIADAIDARKPHPNNATTPIYGFGMQDVGTCSVTDTIVCEVDGDCPGGETCDLGAEDESTFYPIIIDIGVEDADYLACWAICETDGGAPLEEGANSIVSCTDLGQGRYELILDHGAKAGYVTTIEYLGDITGTSYVEYIHLPADADGSGDSNGNDIIAVVDCLNHQN